MRPVAYTSVTGEDYVMADTLTEDPPEVPTDTPPQDPPFWAVITPDARVEWHHGKPDDGDLHEAVGGYLEAARSAHSGSLVAFVNEDGQRLALLPNIAGTRFLGVDQPVLLGNVAITGPSDGEGEITPLPAEVRMRLAREVAEA